jgi:hypothetical protein
VSDSSKELACPVCKTMNTEQALASQGVVVSGVEAMFKGDFDTVQAVFESASPYDTHIAIVLLADTIDDLCRLVYANPMEYLHDMREQLNAALAKVDTAAIAATPKAIDSDGTDGADGPA